ncbi:MAG: hypothetical protein WC792_06475 [Candidatus Micrarchaeia archaeon]|jgi:hypothetical protein
MLRKQISLFREFHPVLSHPRFERRLKALGAIFAETGYEPELVPYNPGKNGALHLFLKRKPSASRHENPAVTILVGEISGRTFKHSPLFTKAQGHTATPQLIRSSKALPARFRALKSGGFSKTSFTHADRQRAITGAALQIAKEYCGGKKTIAALKTTDDLPENFKPAWAKKRREN